MDSVLLFTTWMRPFIKIPKKLTPKSTRKLSLKILHSQFDVQVTVHRDKFL